MNWTSIVEQTKTVYRVDPLAGDDANPPGKPWRSFARINGLHLAAGDVVVISPGEHELSLTLSGGGSEAEPLVFRFLAGVHTIAIDKAVREPMYVSNACDSPDPKPIAILVRQMQHVRFEGEPGARPPTIQCGGRMVQVWNDHYEDVTFTGLTFDLKRPTVSEFRVLEANGPSAVIAVAEGSDYLIKDGRFLWTGDWGPGDFCQEAVPNEGTCWRRKAPRGWSAQGQIEAFATEWGERKVRLPLPRVTRWR
jgi:hypothetical protein